MTRPKRAAKTPAKAAKQPEEEAVVEDTEVNEEIEDILAEQVSFFRNLVPDMLDYFQIQEVKVERKKILEYE